MTDIFCKNTNETETLKIFINNCLFFIQSIIFAAGKPYTTSSR